LLRAAIAGLTFAALYGVAIRLYFYLRASRETHRWHLSAVAAAGLVGGAAFYVAQQIQTPHAPGVLDAAAFVIMAVAAAAVPAILETVHVVQARILLGTRVTTRSDTRAERPPSEPDGRSAGP
jgi:hypothetical protein